MPYWGRTVEKCWKIVYHYTIVYHHEDAVVCPIQNEGEMMTAETKVLDQIRRCFSIWSDDLRQNGQVNRLSDHISSENIAAGLLNRVFGYQLRNANQIHPNHRAVDLVDRDALDGGGVAVQITTTNTRQKINNTMEGFEDGSNGKPLADRYSELIVLILTMDKKFTNWEKFSSDDYQLTILNLMDLSRAMEELDLDRMQEILEFLNQQLGLGGDERAQCRERIRKVARILDAEAVQTAAGKKTDGDVDKFYMVDPNFDLMLRVISAGADVPHTQLNARLDQLCAEGGPVILTGHSGTGKTAIMLRTAVSWARSGGIALWLCPEENVPLTAQFYEDVLAIAGEDGRVLLCMDNPALWAAGFSALAKNWPGDARIRLLLAERVNRLNRMTSANDDQLYHWFDGATVAAMMVKKDKDPYRLKDYRMEYIPEDYRRKTKILEKSVQVMFRRGQIRSHSQADAVRYIMKEYNRGNVGLVELIYRAKFWLRDFATVTTQLCMDWDEWQRILKKELKCQRDALVLYGAVALCDFLEIPITVSLFCRLFDLDRLSLTVAMDKWRMDKSVEPVTYREGRETLVPKHGVIAELFFLFNRPNRYVRVLLEDLLKTMTEPEIEAFLEKTVRKGNIQREYWEPMGKIFFRDHLEAIYRRTQNGTLGLTGQGKARLALGLLYSVGKDHRKLGGDTLSMVEQLDSGLDGGVLSASLYTEWGRLLANMKKQREAEARFRAVLTADTKDIHSRTELGRLLSKQPGREGEAEQFLMEILGFDPENIQARTELGRLLSKQPGREGEAEAILMETVRLKPDDIQSRTELGRLLSKQPGREEEAERFLREAIRIDPQNLHPHTELAKLYTRQGGFFEAEGLYRKVLEIDPRNAYAREGLQNLARHQSAGE